MTITDAVPKDDSVVEASHRYFVDSTEADQGVATATGDRTIKDHVDAIGATKKATMYFRHDFDADTTSYTVTTSETIPDNITLDVEQGSIFVGAGTLTVEGYIHVGLEQAYNAAGVIVFSGTGGDIDTNFEILTDGSVADSLHLHNNNENILINQDFSIWQENTTFTNPAGAVYTADGYYVWHTAGGGTSPTVNVKKNTSVHEDAFEQSMELEITNTGASGSTRQWYFKQDVEDFAKYRGKTTTFAIRYTASTAITLPGRILVYDGIASQQIDINSISTDYATQNISITVNASADRLHVYFYLVRSGSGAISTTGSIYIQWMKLELGSVATPLIPRKTGEELALCQRYYQKSYLETVFAGVASEVGAVFFSSNQHTNSDCTVIFPVILPIKMKAIPTITLYDMSGTLGSVTMVGDGKTPTLARQTEHGFTVQATQGAPTTTRKLAFHYTAISRVQE